MVYNSVQNRTNILVNSVVVACLQTKIIPLHPPQTAVFYAFWHHAHHRRNLSFDGNQWLFCMRISHKERASREGSLKILQPARFFAHGARLSTGRRTHDCVRLRTRLMLASKTTDKCKTAGVWQRTFSLCNTKRNQTK